MHKRYSLSVTVIWSVLLIACGAAKSFAQTNFGSVNVTGRGTALVTVGILTPGTLGSISVLTQGALLQDFSDVGGGTCATDVIYPANATCTVKVMFSPVTAGTKYGAVLLNDASGNLLASSYIVGTGVGPQLVFMPGVQNTINGNWVQPWATAVDGSGNIYVANYPSGPNASGGSIVKETFSGGTYTESTIGSGFVAPSGVAVDGQGNVYVIDSSSRAIYQEMPSPAGYIQTQVPATGLALPIAIAVDAGGNLYITDAANQKVVKETPSGGSYIQSFLGNGLSSPTGIAVDGNGSVYVGDWGNHRVVMETPSGTGYVQSTLLDGIQETGGLGGSIATDGRGNLFIAETSLNQLVMYPWSGQAYGPPVTIANVVQPMGVAISGSGNVFFTVDTGILYSLDLADSPSFSFESAVEGSSSNDSPQVLTVSNIGNADLKLPVPFNGANPSVPQNFSVDWNAASACPHVNSGSATAGVLSQGSMCQLPISFTPLTVGNLTGSLVLTDNEFNAPSPSYASQSIALNGVGLPKTPVIQWSFPSPIVYGTPLTSVQLNATANVAGTFLYSPPIGTILPAGAQNLSVVFTPTDTVNYSSAAASVLITVNQAVPSLTWSAPAGITYGTALNAIQLNATSPLPGSFNYTPGFGTVLSAGTQTLSVTFTPSDSIDYTTATATVPLSVKKAVASVTWVQPAPITYGTPLSAGQLNATSSVPGTFNYSPPAGTFLPAGTQSLSVTFNPTDTTDYTPAAASVSLIVNKATPPITWPTPTAITYGTALSAAQLDATASIAGTFTYSYPAGTILGAGSQTLSVTFSPNDTANYTAASSSVALTVNQAIPTIAWATPAAITYGTPLNSTQLNASSPIAGTFSYATPAGTVLTAGSQILSVTFTPTDNTDFTTATASVALLINKAVPVVTWIPPAAISYGIPLSATQLNAGSIVAGTFAYSPGFGMILPAGAKTLSVVFTPTDANDYTTAKASVSLTINKAIPAITWAAPMPISYGNMLSAKQLNATAPVGGVFSYSSPSGTIFPAGTQTLSTVFTPTDTANYTTATATVMLIINRAVPLIAWAAPAQIVFGTTLSSVQLNASSPLLGTFAYSSPAGTILPAGSNTVSVTFNPADSANYTTATASVVVRVSKSQVAITWPTPAAITYGTALSNVQLNAQASVPGNYVYTKNSGAILQAGSYTILVTFTATDNRDYASATASVPLTVLKNVLTVTVVNRNKVYGEALPSLAYVLTGLVNGDQEGRDVSGKPAITTSATASSPVGTYPIAIAPGTITTANYTFVFVPGTLTVTPAVLQVTANNASESYGAPLSALAYHIQGVVNGDSIASAITGVPSLTTTAAANSPAGVYPILLTAGTLKAANYTFAFIPGTLTVRKAELSISANDAQSIYGSAIPNFTYTLSGLVNGDIANRAFTGSPSLTSPASKGSPAGKYPITASNGTLASNNYSFVFGAGSLLISKANLTVTPDNKTAVYGAGLPQLTYLIKGFLDGDTAASAVAGTPSLKTIAGTTPAVGTYSITASLGTLSSPNYGFTFGSGTLTITKVALTVTADAVGRVYGSSLPPLTYTFSGFQYSDTAKTAVSGTPGITTAATVTSRTGTYPIAVAAGSLTALNYSFRFVGSNLIISKAPLTVTAIDQTISYGSPVPALTYQFNGLLNGDTPASALRGTPTLSTSAKLTSQVGSYPIAIQPGTLSATNYAFTFVSGTLKINKAVLIVTAINQTMVQGSQVPVLTYSLSGFVSYESITNELSGMPSLKTTATSKSLAGSYPINVTIGTLTAPNYSFSLANGVVTITP